MAISTLPILTETTSLTTGTLLYVLPSPFTSGQKTSLDTLSNFIISNYGLMKEWRSGESYIVVETTSNEITNGVNLLSKLSGICDDRPYGKDRSKNNPKTLLLPPGVYDLNGQILQITGSGINIIGMGSPKSTIIYYSGKSNLITSTIAPVSLYLSANECMVSNLTIYTKNQPNGINIPQIYIGGISDIVLSNLILTGDGTGSYLLNSYGKSSIIIAHTSLNTNKIDIENIKANGAISDGNTTEQLVGPVNINNSEFICNDYFLNRYGTFGDFPVNTNFEFNNCILISNSGALISDANSNADSPVVANFNFNNCYISGKALTAYSSLSHSDPGGTNYLSGRFTNCTIDGTIEGFGGYINSCRIKSMTDTLPAVFVNKQSGAAINTITSYNLQITNSTLIGGKNCSASISGLGPSYSHSLVISNCQTNKSITGFKTIISGYNLTNSSIF